MKLSVRLFLGYFFIVAVAGQLVLLLLVKQISPGVRTALEASLVDTANLLAELAAPELKAGRLSDGDFGAAVRRYASRPVSAEIFDFPKRSLDYRVYLTDAKGIVLFDSSGQAVGQDYSRWNDVYLTLQGRYGARSSRTDPNDDRTSVMHVAAPIRDGDRLLGVLAVAYPTALLQPIVDRSEAAVRVAALWLFGGALAFGALFTWRLTRAIDLLVAYARAVTAGGRAVPPRLGSPEMATLAGALETMREELEGKQYVEHYVQNLTHEMKSPLAALRGASELLQEPLPEVEQFRFARNVQEQTQRLEFLIERLLGLAAVESRQVLQNPVKVNLGEVLSEVSLTLSHRLVDRRLCIRRATDGDIELIGEPFLLTRAVSNLLENAIEFSPRHQVIEIGLVADGQEAVLTVADRGPGVPDYARDRVFERFYSLPRPDTGRKSTGIGLAFVREVALLHGGSISLNNREGGGAVATLRIPLG